MTALSSVQAEYIAFSTCAEQLVWIRNIIYEIEHQERWNESLWYESTNINVENQSTISLIKNPHVSAKAKTHRSENVSCAELLQRGNF